jgi:hypothetical protein
MSILAAILAHARHVTLYVAGIQLPLVEGRREENHQAIATTNQVLFNRSHRALSAVAFSRAGYNRPRLDNRVDATLIVLH